MSVNEYITNSLPNVLNPLREILILLLMMVLLLLMKVLLWVKLETVLFAEWGYVDGVDDIYV